MRGRGDAREGFEVLGFVGGEEVFDVHHDWVVGEEMGLHAGCFADVGGWAGVREWNPLWDAPSAEIEVVIEDVSTKGAEKGKEEQ